MEEDFYTPSLMASLLASGTQALPTAQPVQTATSVDEAVDPYTGLTKAQTDAQIAALLGGSVDIGNPGIVPEWEQYRAPSYSAPTMEYLSSLDKYIAQNDPSFGMMYSKAPTVDLSTPEKTRQYSLYGIGDFLPEEQVAAYASKPFEQNVGFTVAPTEVGVGKNVTGALDVGYNTPIILRDDATGEIVYQGTGFAGAQEAARLSNQMSATGDKKTQWSLLTGDPGATDISQFNVVAQDKPDYLGGVLGALVQYGLPLGLSLIPGVGWAGSAALAGAGSTAGKLISGYDVGDALKSGLITAGTAGLLRAPILDGGNSISGALTNAVGLGGAPTSAFDKAFDADYASWLASGPAGAAGAAGAAGLGAGLAAAVPEIVVLGGAGGLGTLGMAALGTAALGGLAGATGVLGGTPAASGALPGDIVVTGAPSAGVSLPAVGAGVGAGAGAGAGLIGGEVPVPEDIVVEAQKPSDVLNGELPPPPITSVNIPPNAGTTLPDTGGSLLNDILKYYSLGSGVLDMLGVGKGGAGSTTPYTSVLGNVPTFGRGAFQPFTGDYETYAQGPEWNFFGTNNG